MQQTVNHPSFLNRQSSPYRYQDTNNETKPIAIVSLEMGDKMEEIRVHEGEDIQLLTELFCQRFGLGDECVDYIVDRINDQINQKEPSPRFQAVCESFGNQQDFPTKSLQPSQSKQSDVGLTTEASSIKDECSDKKDSSQQKWEMWQQQLKTKQLNHSSNTVVWNLSNKTTKGEQFQKKQTTNERLYRDGLDIQRIRQENADQHKKQRCQQELDQATFHPQISPKSREIATKKYNYNSNIGQTLYDKGKELNKKKLLDIQKHQDQLRKLSPFRPQGIPNRSKSPTPIYDKLYNDAIDGKERKDKWVKQEFEKVCPFQPKSKSPIRIVNKNQQQAQVQKLFNEQEERKRKIDQKKFDLQQSTQSTFKPTITKDIHYQKVSKRTDYEDSQLAQDILKLSSRINKQQSQPLSQQIQQNSQHQRQMESKQISQQSSQISNRQSQFDLNVNKIFQQLDGDKNGQISSEALDLSTINADVLEIVSEVLYQMEDEKLTLSQSTFRDLCLNLGLEQKLNKLMI